MTLTLENALQALSKTVSGQLEVIAIGLAGGDRPLPQPGESDLDIFVYCSNLPAPEERRAFYLANNIEGVDVEKIPGSPWGHGDLLYLHGVETWLLYMTAPEVAAELDDILNGKQMERLEFGFYPIARCAMYLGMRILYEKSGFLSSLKNKLQPYPETLAKQGIDYHLESLKDTEDLERAIHRKDPLFYHYALDYALDHFLQALFALNRIYFPSRKRSFEFMRTFKRKPALCEERLLEALKSGVQGETLPESYRIFYGLVADLQALVGDR